MPIMPNISIKKQNKSRYITSELYLYTLIRYIEYNPIEAGLSTKAGEYHYTLAHLIFNSKDFYPCTKESVRKSQVNIIVSPTDPLPLLLISNLNKGITLTIF
jgi:hypothetical protein